MKALLRSIFVRNNTAEGVQTSLSTLAAKATAKVRHDTMEGKNYLVVPMVILTEGVHKGSEGALYYPPSELSKTPAVWNHKPVVVYHPQINGNGVSACDPDILTNHKVGVMMNTRWEPKTKRLTSEAWIDPERAEDVDPRIMEAVNTGTMLELSTGVFVDSEEDPGKWGKEEYSGIARNYRPDHLAILPDLKGACSIADGAGFLRNQRADNDNAETKPGQGEFGPNGQTMVNGKKAPRKGGRLSQVEREARKRMKKMLAGTSPGDPMTYEPGVGGESSYSNPQANQELTSNDSKGGYLVVESDGTKHLPTRTGGKPDHRLMGAAWAALHGGYRGQKYGGPNKSSAIAKLKKMYSAEGMDTPSNNEESGIKKLLYKFARHMGLAANELPFDYIRTALNDAIMDECGVEDGYYGGPRPYVVDVYPSSFVYEYEGQLFQLGYTATDDGVTLDEGDPVEVEREPASYKKVSANSSDGEQSENKEQTNNMNKEKIVSQLIANSGGQLTEADRPRLLAFTEQQLGMIKFVDAQGQPVANAGKASKSQPDDSDDDSEDDDEQDEPPAKKGKGKKANNAAAGATNVQDYIAAAPAEIQEVLTNGMASYNEEKSKIVKTLAKNGAFSETELQSKPLVELRKLAKLAASNQPAAPARFDYSGMAPVGNASGETVEQEALVPPTMNFGKTETATK
jgi:hypothetical protein